MKVLITLKPNIVNDQMILDLITQAVDLKQTESDSKFFTHYGIIRGEILDKDFPKLILKSNGAFAISNLIEDIEIDGIKTTS